IHYLKTKTIYLKDLIWWSGEYLNKKLGKDFKIMRPRMPLSDNAKYKEWKIYFERHFPYINDDVILIGCSLGGIFLAKYLSENKFPKKILATYLVCPPFDNSLPGEELAGGFKLKSNLSLIEKNSNNLTLMFSKDDPIVPVSHAEKFRKKLKTAKIIIYESKNGHFIMSKFPEIIKMIKKDIKRVNGHILSIKPFKELLNFKNI
ncbi:MAG: alpha/beta hydrolase, partial [Candidatus Gracilibacteria bacterium]